MGVTWNDTPGGELALDESVDFAVDSDPYQCVVGVFYGPDGGPYTANEFAFGQGTFEPAYADNSTFDGTGAFSIRRRGDWSGPFTIRVYEGGQVAVSKVFGKVGEVGPDLTNTDGAVLIENTGEPGGLEFRRLTAGDVDGLDAAVSGKADQVDLDAEITAREDGDADNAADIAAEASARATADSALSTLYTALLATVVALVTGVSSVFGRSGAITAQAGDYPASKITNDSSVSGSYVKDALNNLLSTLAGLVTGVASVFGRSGTITAQAGDYGDNQITNGSSWAGSYIRDALNAIYSDARWTDTRTPTDNTVSTAKIQANAVALSKLPTQANNTILGNNSGSTAVPSALTAAQVKTLLGLVAADVTGAVSTTSLTRDLSAHTAFSPTFNWPMSGSGTATDDSTNGNNGTGGAANAGPSWDGVRASSSGAAGLNTYSLPSNTLVTTGAFTLEWLGVTGASGNANNMRASGYWQCNFGGTGAFTFTQTEGGVGQTITTTAWLPTGAWTHFVLTRASDGKTIKLYMNGILVWSTVRASACNATGTVTPQLFVVAGSAVALFAGYLSERSAADALTLYKKRFGVT